MSVRGLGSKGLTLVLVLALCSSCADEIAEPALQVSDTNLPNGVQGEPYSKQLGATGGSGGHTWSTVSGSWPSGITLSPGGLVSGTPSVNGDFVATVKVASGGQNATRQYQLSIDPPAPVVTSQPPLPNGVQGVAYSQQLGAAGGVGGYSWSTISGSWPPGIALSAAGLVSGIPSASGAFSVAVQVASGGRTAARSFQLTIDPLLSITTISPLPGGRQSTAYSLQLDATGGVGGYTWSTVSGTWPPGLSLSAAGRLSGTPSASGSFNATAQVASVGQTASRAYQLTIDAPLSIATAGLPEGMLGTPYNQQLSASGGAGSYSWSTVSGAWPQGISLTATGVVSGTPAASGTFDVTVQVGSSDQTATQAYRLIIVLPSPAITSTSPLPAGTQGVGYSQQLSATGGTGSYSWSTVSGSWPPGISLSSTGALSGTPTASGTFNATAQVSSGGQTGTRAYQLTINPQALSITTASPLPVGTQGISYSEQLQATGGTGAYSWSTVGGSWPNGISLSSAGLVSGTATVNGTFSVTVEVSSGGQTASRTYQVTVTPPPPSITTSSPLPPATLGVPYTLQLAATGGTGSYSWGSVGSWPPGISLSVAGVVSGTPGAIGTFTVTVQVTSGGQTASRGFQLTVNPPALTITTASPLPNATRGAAYSQQLTATGGTGSYSWSTTSGSWPSGLSLSSAGVVSGTPTVAGTFNATAQVTSGGQTTSRAYQLTVVHPPLAIATVSPLPGGNQNTPYSQQLTATGGTGTYSWSTISGAWPTGISLSSAGVVSGTPTVTGTFNATAQVSSGGQTASRAYQLTISPPPPSITTTSPLPSGTQGVLYTQQLNASGGTGSYSWSTTSGSWPAGISLSGSGVLSGTPTASGTFNATARVSSGGQTASKAFQLTIAPPVTYTLTLNLGIGGWDIGVAVTSSPAGINCSLYYGPGFPNTSTICSANYASGVQVTLSPNHNGSWTNCDSIGPNNTCRVTMGAAGRSVSFTAF